MSIEVTKLQEKAQKGYTVCFIESCPKHGQCLRYQVGQHGKTLPYVVPSVNPLNPEVKSGNCPLFKSEELQRMAKGMMHLLTDDMPSRTEKAIRHELFAYFGRTLYYEYRKGLHLLSPKQQEDIADILKFCGWKKEPQFDEYVEDYDW